MRGGIHEWYPNFAATGDNIMLDMVWMRIAVVVAPLASSSCLSEMDEMPDSLGFLSSDLCTLCNIKKRRKCNVWRAGDQGVFGT